MTYGQSDGSFSLILVFLLVNLLFLLGLFFFFSLNLSVYMYIKNELAQKFSLREVVICVISFSVRVC